MMAWIYPRRLLRPRTLGYLSLALLAAGGSSDSEEDGERNLRSDSSARDMEGRGGGGGEYDDKDANGSGWCEDEDDGSSMNDTVVGSGDGLGEIGGLLAEYDEKHGAAGILSGAAARRRREFLLKCLRRLDCLLPSFLVSDGKAPAQLHPSAWLDGLRGIAAFLVVWHHSSLMFFSWTIHDGFHSNVDNPSDPTHSYFIQRPIIRLLIAGAPQVKVFFVVSGYALAHKPLRLSRQGRFTEFASSLSGSVFRRHPRLFLPAIVVMAANALAGYWEFIGRNPVKPSEEEGAEAPPAWNQGAAVQTRELHRFDNGTEAFQNWWHTVLVMTDPFNGDGRRGGSPYDWNLWTLPMEFDCSMAVFLFLAAFAWLRPKARITLAVLIAGFALWYTHWPQFLFLAGLVICDLNFQSKAGMQKQNDSSSSSSSNSLLPKTEGERESGDVTQANETADGSVALLPMPVASGEPQHQPQPSRARRTGVVLYHRAWRLIIAVWALYPQQLHDAVSSTRCFIANHPITARLGATYSSSLLYLRSRRPSLSIPPQFHIVGGIRPLRTAISRITPWHLLSTASFVFALHLLAFPELNRGGRTTPGYATLAEWIAPNYSDEEGHWWLSIGAALLVLTVDRAPFLQRLFTTRFAQYMGRISFALYLVHGPMIFSLGWHIGRSCTEIYGRETPGGYAKGVVLAYALLWPILIWTADLVWRLVDVKAVEFGKWAYESLLAKREDEAM